VAVGAIALAGIGCGGDDSDEGEARPSASTVREAPLVALTDQQICDGLTADDVGAALGLVVTEAAPGGSSTAQCAYDYTTRSGTTSNVSVASLSPEVDLGGRTGDAAFDHVLEINRSLAAGTDAEEVDVDAGDRAVRLSGESLHFGAVAAGDHLLTVIVPAGDADGEAVDALLAVVADRLG
jgi:hypothetical protein